jgi:4-amino-4-deoxychorismate lyase
VAAPRLVVDADGKVQDRDRPFLRADDLGVVRGDGIFESVLVVDGRPDLLDEHLDRLDRSAASTGITVPDREVWRRGLASIVDAWEGGREIAVRLLVTRGPMTGGPPTCYLLADPVPDPVLEQRHQGIAAVTLERGTDPAVTEAAPWLLLGAKTLSYAVNMAAGRWAQEHGADDAIFVTGPGLVLEAPTAAVVAAVGRSLLSPPPSTGILASITLGRLLATAGAAGWDARLASLTVEDLHRADGVWLVSAVRLATRVHTLDGRRLAAGGPGDEVAALAAPGQGSG